MSTKKLLWVMPAVLMVAGFIYFSRTSRDALPPPLVAPPQHIEAPPEAKELTHEEALRWVADHRAWRRARKTKPISARVLDADEVGKEFQTADHAIEKGRPGFWLCAGVAGEPWFQALEKIESKYELAGEELKTFAFDPKPRTYRIFKPRSSTRNWAAQVDGPAIAGFFIRPNYDPAHPLYAPRGGYVVRDDVDDPYQATPNDVWLVQQGLFESTYELIP